MTTPILSAIQATDENIKFFNEYDYKPTDFAELNKDALKVGDVVVTMTIHVPDPIDDAFKIRHTSHWIITETTFNEKFVISDPENYPDLKKFVLIRTK